MFIVSILYRLLSLFVLCIVLTLADEIKVYALGVGARVCRGKNVSVYGATPTRKRLELSNLRRKWCCQLANTAESRFTPYFLMVKNHG